jgi:rhomboid protease GluP
VDILEYYGARINVFIRAGEVWRFFTPALLHGSITHILFNMYALYSIGGSVERFFGARRFVTLYILAAFSGNVLSFYFGDDNSIAVGASTAIFGLIGAEAVFFIQNRKLFGEYARNALGNIAFVIAINLFIGLAPMIDNWGHLGGFFGGVIFAWFAGPLWELEGEYPVLRLADRRGLREIVTGAGLVSLLFGGLAVAGIAFGL